MKKFTYLLLNNYKNNGQNEEQSIRYRFNGKIESADNFHGHDIVIDGINYQIKSVHATIGYGTDLHKCIEEEPSQAYIMALNGTGYLMSKAEFEEFAKEFHCHDKDSRTGLEKIRLTRALLKMVDYLEKRQPPRARAPL